MWIGCVWVCDWRVNGGRGRRRSFGPWRRFFHCSALLRVVAHHVENDEMMVMMNLRIELCLDIHIVNDVVKMTLNNLCSNAGDR